jgi:hypothetical protein
MRTASKIAATALIALAAVAAAPAFAPGFSGAIANAVTALPAAGQIGSPAQFTRMSAREQAVAQGPGGCITFNEAVAAAVATQIRRGDLPEARRLAALEVPCAR